MLLPDLKLKLAAHFKTGQPNLKHYMQLTSFKLVDLC